MGFKIKQNDTSPLMVVTLKDAAGNAIDLTAATVRFHMKRISSTSAKVDVSRLLSSPKHLSQVIFTKIMQ